MRRLTIALLSVACCLAVGGAVTASSASVSEFVADEYPAGIKGEQTERFEIELNYPGGPLVCDEVEFNSELSESTAQMVGTEYFPAETSCHFGEAKEYVGNVYSNGCDWVLNAGEEIGEGEFEGTVDLVCPGEAGIEVDWNTWLPCDVTILPQEGLGTVTYKHDLYLGSFPAILMTFDLGEVEWEQPKVPPLCSQASGTTGAITGEQLVSAHDESLEPIGFTIE